VTLNYKLTKDVADLKQELKKQQEEHDQRLVDLYAQIADVNKKLETTTTEKNNIHEHYQRWKRTWTTQIADQDRTIQDQRRQMDAMATTLEVMAKRPRT
jgi:isocitrate/isopropylmalate dehydrogenase